MSMKKSKGQDHVIIINISLQRFTRMLQCDITTEILHITHKKWEYHSLGTERLCIDFKSNIFYVGEKKE